MIPNKVIVLDKMPLTINGKVDMKKLKEYHIEFTQQICIAPRTEIEHKICNCWKNEMKRDTVYVTDNFFEMGGNSLIAVSLINRINSKLSASLSLQVLFECPTIEKLALKVVSGEKNAENSSRLVKLQEKGSKNPIYCWPGLGGYCMNLRLLAEKIGTNQRFYGIQAYGINKNETPYLTIKEMAMEDIKMIKKIQPVGPYTLWGYSFGARVAFEVAYQLEQSGAVVDKLFLIAPGSPKIKKNGEFLSNNGKSTFSNKAYIIILFSVFMGNDTHNALNECLQIVNDEESFVKYITTKNNKLEPDIVKKIINIVSQTYEFKYSFNELKDRCLNAPITIFKAHGDDYSFIENNSGFSTTVPTVVELKADHYSMLKDTDIEELVKTIKQNSTSDFTKINGNLYKENKMPHIIIKHFPLLSKEQQSELAISLTKVVTDIIKCDEGAVSIALEPIEKEFWNELVYIPEIVNRKKLLFKSPNY